MTQNLSNSAMSLELKAGIFANATGNINISTGKKAKPGPPEGEIDGEATIDGAGAGAALPAAPAAAS